MTWNDHRWPFSWEAFTSVLLFSLVVLVACSPGPGTATHGAPTPQFTPAVDADVNPTPALDSGQAAGSTAIDQFIARISAAGAAVVNNGHIGQGLFPGDDIKLWQLLVNGMDVNVFEFADEAARQSISDNIAPNGSEFTVHEGDTVVTTHWDSAWLPRFWAVDNLIVNYWGEDEAVISSLDTALGPPFTDGSKPYRPEPHSGAVAGIGEYGVHFQYDPYLAAGVRSQVAAAFTEEGAMGQMLLPEHLAFIFSDSYADAEPLLRRQQLNLESMPRIMVYPAAAYAAMQPLARAQIKQLQALLAAQPSIPGGTLPYLPLHNAAQVFYSQLTYLEFGSGAGVRYLTAYSQEASPVTNQQLIYTFQGLTDDGQHYVAAFFPVKTAALPDTIQVDDWDAFNRSYPTYVAETKRALDDLTPFDFTPDLALLDAVVTSLQVAPDVELGGAAASELDPEPLWLVGPYGVYQVWDGNAGLYRLYRVEKDGRPLPVAEQGYPLRPAPDAAHAAYMDDEARLWLIDLADGSQRRLAEGSSLASLHLWGDSRTLLVGVHLAAAGEGPSSGHLATLDIGSGELQVIDQEHLSMGRPAMASDGQSIAYSIAALSPGEIGSGRIYRPDSGSQALDPSRFAGLEGEGPCNLYNPAWSPDGRLLAWLCAADSGSRLVVFDLVRQTALTLFTWQPAQFGALPPSPVWSHDGKWLAIEVWANNKAESGLWVLPADGTLARLRVPTGHEPIWLNPSQLIYANLDENMNGDLRLADLDLGEIGVLDLPPGSSVLLADW